MIGGVIMVSVAVAMLAGFIAFYRYSGTAAWEASDTRRALLNVIVAVGPLLGMHYKPTPPPLPGIMTPGPEDGEEPEDAEGGPPEEVGSGEGRRAEDRGDEAGDRR